MAAFSSGFRHALTDGIEDLRFAERRNQEAEQLAAGLLKMRRKPFSSAEEPFDLVALLVKGTIIFPRMQPVGLGRHCCGATES
jgi:hypothetical protein